MGRHQETRRPLTSLCPRRGFKNPGASADRPQLRNSKPFCYMPFAETYLSTIYKPCITAGPGGGPGWGGGEGKEKSMAHRVSAGRGRGEVKAQNGSKTRGSSLIMETEGKAGYTRSSYKIILVHRNHGALPQTHANLATHPLPSECLFIFYN